MELQTKGKESSAVPSFTKQAIMDAFLRLLAHRPFRKITVRNIVEECGVNRTTFYYYYQDIFAIVEDLVAATLAPCIDTLTGKEDSAALRDALDFATMFRRSLCSLWVGIGEENVRRYVFAVLDEPIRQMVLANAEGLDATPAECEAVRLLARESLFGFFGLFVRGELPEGIDHLAAATRGTVRTLLENTVRLRKGGVTHE